jgi:uncharacterized secreted protein with C-terminal beta-propeller domain
LKEHDMNLRRTLATLTALAIVGMSSSASATAPDTAQPFELQSDKQCKVMKEQFLEMTAMQATEQWYWNNFYQHRNDYMGSVRELDDAPASSAAPSRQTATRAAKAESAASAGSGSSGPENYTTTNNQERGVDEADIVKTDGKYIYTLTGDEIVIVKSWPVEDARIVSRLKLGSNARPTMLFLNGDKLVAMSYVNNAMQIGAGKRRRGWYGATRVSVIDIRNRANPYVVRNLDFEGYTNQARMIGDDVYVVTNSAVQAPQQIWEITGKFDGWPEFDQNHSAHDSESVAKIKRAAYKKVRRYLDRELASIDFETALPHMRVSGYRGKFAERPFKPMIACDDIHVPRSGVQYGMVSLVHFDIKRPWKVNTSGVFGNGWQIYGSQNAIYVAMPNYGYYYWYRWLRDEAPEADEYNTTFIHKFDLRRDVGKPTYAASGRVRGYLLNQFSMDEEGGDLRVATTDMNWWGGRGNQPENFGNHIYVLRPDGNQLATIGRVEGLAPGERIFSARMFGDKGYVVTFRQTDPLYTLDLSDPTQPEVVGELKINGFSSYIHPMGNDQLLTVGQDADDDGRVKGVHLQIFDVSDPSTPTRSHHYTFETMGYSWSAAQWDHKAFTYDPRTGTLALPMQFYPRNNTGDYFNGIFVFDVDAKKGFTDKGSVSHDSLIEGWRARHCEKNPNDYYCRYPNQRHYWWGWSNLNRSIIMDDVIFTLSNLGIMAHKLDDTDRSLASVRLARM